MAAPCGRAPSTNGSIRLHSAGRHSPRPCPRRWPCKLAPRRTRGRSPCDGADAEAYRAYLAGRYQMEPTVGQAHAPGALGFPTRDRPRPELRARLRRHGLCLPCAGDDRRRGSATRRFRWPRPPCSAPWRSTPSPKPTVAGLHPVLVRLGLGRGRDLAASRDRTQSQFRRGAAGLCPSVEQPRSPRRSGRAGAPGRGAGSALAADQRLVLELHPLRRRCRRGRARAGKALEIEPDFWIALLVRAGGAMARQRLRPRDFGPAARAGTVRPMQPGPGAAGSGLRAGR